VIFALELFCLPRTKKKFISKSSPKRANIYRPGEFDDLICSVASDSLLLMPDQQKYFPNKEFVSFSKNVLSY
jgi:hypothetical protein